MSYSGAMRATALERSWGGNVWGFPVWSQYHCIREAGSYTSGSGHGRGCTNGVSFRWVRRWFGHPISEEMWSEEQSEKCWYLGLGCWSCAGEGCEWPCLQVRGDGMGQEIMSWLRGWGWGYVLRIRGFVIRRRSLEIWIYSRNIVVNCWREFIFCFRNWRTRGWCSVLVKWVLLGVWKW